ncbi:hypothetical protein ACLOJK_017001 [Asimina triloba]
MMSAVLFVWQSAILYEANRSRSYLVTVYGIPRDIAAACLRNENRQRRPCHSFYRLSKLQVEGPSRPEKLSRSSHDCIHMGDFLAGQENEKGGRYLSVGVHAGIEEPVDALSSPQACKCNRCTERSASHPIENQILTTGMLWAHQEEARWGDREPLAVAQVPNDDADGGRLKESKCLGSPSQQLGATNAPSIEDRTRVMDGECEALRTVPRVSIDALSPRVFLFISRLFPRVPITALLKNSNKTPPRPVFLSTFRTEFLFSPSLSLSQSQGIHLSCRTKAKKMRTPLHETTPIEEEDSDREKAKTTGFALQNHLGPKTRETELRLGFSSAGFQDTGSVEDGGGQKLSGFVLKPKNSSFGAKRWFSETEGGFANPWKQEKAVFDPSHQQRRIDSSPTAARLHFLHLLKFFWEMNGTPRERGGCGRWWRVELTGTVQKVGPTIGRFGRRPKTGKDTSY